MIRLVYRQRIRFHDWIWSGGDRENCGLARRVCRRLPLYFSDPHVPSKRHMRRIEESPSVGVRIPPGCPRMVRLDPNNVTATSGGPGSTYYLSWD